MNENMHGDENNPYNGDAYDSYTSGTGNAAMVYGEENEQGGVEYPYNQNVGGYSGTPYRKTESSDNSYNTPPKSSWEIKRTKRYIIAGVIIAAALIIVATAGLILFNPKKSLYGALKRTYNAKNLMEGGPGEAVRKFNDEGGELSATVSLSGSGVKNADVKPGARADIVKDGKNGKLSGEVALTKAGSDAATVQIYSENGKTYVTADNVIDGYFAADNDGFVETYNKSVLSKTFGEIDSEKLKGIEFVAHLFGNQEQETGNKNQNQSLIEKAFRGAKVKKAGSTELTVAGEPAKCKVYEVTLEKEAAVRFLSGIAGLVGGPDGQQSGQGGQQKPDQKPGQGQSDGFDLFDSLSQIPGQLQQRNQEPGIGELIQLFQNAEEVVTGPVTFEVYVDNKYVRGFSTEIDIKGKGNDDATLNIENHNTGIKNPLSSFDFDIKLNDGDQSMEVGADLAYSVDSKALTVKSSMETTSKATGIEAEIDNDSPKDVLSIDSSRQIVDIGTAGDEEVTSFLTKNSEGLKEFLNNVSEVVGTPQGMDNSGLFGGSQNFFSDFFGDDFSDFFNKDEIPSFSDFFDKDEFSDFFGDDFFGDGFSDYFDDYSGNSSGDNKNDNGSDQGNDGATTETTNPLNDDDGAEDF